MTPNATRSTATLRATSGERGQVTVVLAVLLATLVLAIVGLTVVGRAAIDRTRVTSAADAVALATAQDAPAGQEVAQWYRDRGIEVEAHVTGDRRVQASAQTRADHRPHVDATSWAEIGSGPVVASPALIAVISRAEQLLGVDLAATYPSPHAAVVAAEHLVSLTTLFEPLRLCADSSQGDITTISLCAAVV